MRWWDRFFRSDVPARWVDEGPWRRTAKAVGAVRRHGEYLVVPVETWNVRAYSMAESQRVRGLVARQVDGAEWRSVDDGCVATGAVADAADAAVALHDMTYAGIVAAAQAEEVQP